MRNDIPQISKYEAEMNSMQIKSETHNFMADTLVFTQSQPGFEFQNPIIMNTTRGIPECKDEA